MREPVNIPGIVELIQRMDDEKAAQAYLRSVLWCVYDDAVEDAGGYQGAYLNPYNY